MSKTLSQKSDRKVSHSYPQQEPSTPSRLGNQPGAKIKNGVKATKGKIPTKLEDFTSSTQRMIRSLKLENTAFRFPSSKHCSGKQTVLRSETFNKIQQMATSNKVLPNKNILKTIPTIETVRQNSARHTYDELFRLNRSTKQRLEKQKSTLNLLRQTSVSTLYKGIRTQSSDKSNKNPTIRPLSKSTERNRLPKATGKSELFFKGLKQKIPEYDIKKFDFIAKCDQKALSRLKQQTKIGGKAAKADEEKTVVSNLSPETENRLRSEYLTLSLETATLEDLWDSIKGRKLEEEDYYQLRGLMLEVHREAIELQRTPEGRESNSEINVEDWRQETADKDYLQTLRDELQFQTDYLHQLQEMKNIL